MEHAFRGKEKEWAKVISMAWLDDSFKQRLFDDPVTVLKEHGIEFPPGLKVNILEGAEGEINITLPPKPRGIGGSVQDLEDQLSAPTPYWPYYRA